MPERPLGNSGSAFEGRRGDVRAAGGELNIDAGLPNSPISMVWAAFVFAARSG